MEESVQPEFGPLDQADALAILARNHVGRIAFVDGALVDVRPVHYVLGDGWLYGRTTAGSKLEALKRNWRVAFEVDEVDGMFDWRSVIVRGGFYILDPGGSPEEAARWHAAVEALRAVLPETLTERDPVPFRKVVFGIAIQDVTGQAARGRALE